MDAITHDLEIGSFVVLLNLLKTFQNLLFKCLTIFTANQNVQKSYGEAI